MRIETLWTAVTTFGLMVNLYTFADTVQDLRALKRLGRDGVLLVVARGNVRRELIRCMKLAMYSLVGVVSMRKRPYRRASQTDPWIPWAFMGAAALLVANSIFDRVDRQRAVDLLRRPPH